MNNIPCRTSCASCLMPFTKDTGKRESDQYCSLCFKDGKLCYTGTDVKDFQKVCYESMIKNGTGMLKAKFFAWCVQFAPRWKK